MYFGCILGVADIEPHISFLLSRLLSSTVVPPKPCEDFLVLDAYTLDSEVARLGFVSAFAVSAPQKRDVMAKHKDS